MEIMQNLGKFDAVVTDPPYGKIRGEFDHIWTNRGEFLKDVRNWIWAIADCIKFNGSLWWFAWPTVAGRIEAMIAEKMHVLSHVVWEKPTSTGQKTRKESLRAPMPVTERIIFAEHYNSDKAAIHACDKARALVFEPLRKYLADEWRRAGLTNADANACTQSQMATHWFGKSQWELPTKAQYEKLRERANATGKTCLRREHEDLRREYEYFRREYEDLRREYEDLRRWFDCRHGDQFTDLWRFSPAKPSERTKHPTQKPLNLMEYIIRLSVRPDGTCLDPFMGSGTTLVACQRLGRNGTGIELDPEYFEIACRRVEEAARQPKLLPEQ
jgi:site-specific DNA-methyltransferase (adenine-specific)